MFDSKYLFDWRENLSPTSFYVNIFSTTEKNMYVFSDPRSKIRLTSSWAPGKDPKISTQDERWWGKADALGFCIEELLLCVVFSPFMKQNIFAKSRMEWHRLSLCWVLVVLVPDASTSPIYGGDPLPPSFHCQFWVGLASWCILSSICWPAFSPGR